MDEKLTFEELKTVLPKRALEQSQAYDELVTTSADTPTSVFWQVAVVALIVAATRWLSSAKGGGLPRTRNGIDVYGLKLQWRVVGVAGTVFSLALAIMSFPDLPATSGWVGVPIFLAMTIGGI